MKCLRNKLKLKKTNKLKITNNNVVLWCQSKISIQISRKTNCVYRTVNDKNIFSKTTWIQGLASSGARSSMKTIPGLAKSLIELRKYLSKLTVKRTSRGILRWRVKRIQRNRRRKQSLSRKKMDLAKVRSYRHV